MATASRSWRLLAATTLAIAVAGFPPPPAAADNSLPNAIVDGGVTVELRPFVQVPDTDGGDPPRINAMATTGDRLFVVEEHDGIIYEILDRSTTPRLEVFLDVDAAIESVTGRDLDESNPMHSGLRSLAFHPDFATNGLLYVSAMETRPASTTGHHYLSDVATPVAADSVLLEFRQVGGVVDPNSYREVFRVGMPVYDHTIRQIAFNRYAPVGSPDRGLLYIAHGDGSEVSATAGGGQRNDALGKILRIDPRVNGAAPYTVPASNPFVGDPSMLDEVYSLGHRNPHTLAFVPIGGGQTILVSGEPGRDNVEELNIIEAGGDYGWSDREGTFVHVNGGGGVINGIAPLPADEATRGYTYPAAQYGHDGTPGASVTGESIAGGFGITNGSALDGHFFAADFPISGELFDVPIAELVSTVRRLAPGQPPSTLTQATLRRSTILFDHDDNPATPSVVRTSLLDVFDDAPTYRTSRADVRFGQGPDGELYITSKKNNMVYLVTNSVPPSPAPPDVARGPIADATTLDEVLAATDYQPSDAAFLRLYRAFFDRDPDVVGTKYWLARVDQGATFDDVAWAFAASTEFRTRYGALSDEAFIALLYRNVLGRDADPAGQAYWLDQVRRGVLLPHGVVRWVAAGDEFIARFPFAPI
ncbi:MAG: DUF4214 domain-containing protein [Acidimicrobiales bacterium]